MVVSDIILVVSLFFGIPDAEVRAGILFNRSGNFEKSDEILKKISFSKLIVYDGQTIVYYRMLNSYYLNNKKTTKDYAEWLENFSNRDFPERYKTVTSLILQDLQTWKSDDIGDVARDMGLVKERLKGANAGEKTQTEQKIIIAKLDKLIKDMEDKANKKDKKDSKEEKEESSSAPSPANEPLKDSGIENIAGSGKVDYRKLGKIVDGWGHLPPKEREQVLQAMTQFMSPRHREAVENYFRNIAKVKK